MPMLWMFYPIIFFYLKQRLGRLAVVLAVLVFGLIVTQTIYPVGEVSYSLSQLDIFSLAFILGSGFWIESFHQKDLYRRLNFAFLIVIAGMTALFLYGSYTQGQAQWTSNESSSVFLPSLLDQLDKRTYNLDHIRAALNYSLVSMSAMVTMLVLVFNIIVGRIFNQKLAGSLKKRADFMGRLSGWRASEWSLLPILVSFILSIIFSSQLFSTNFNWLVWVAWNLASLSLFPLLLAGMSLVSYLFPRLPFLLVLIVIVIVLIQPPIILAGVGFADVCFDVRKKLKDFSRRIKDEMDDDF